MTGVSALYAGHVVHSRMRPKKHSLRYRVFSLLLDLDELDVLNRSLRFFGHNRRALFSFWDKDHGSLQSDRSLKDWAVGHVRALGIEDDGLSVRVLCYPRIFGYVFNPLTVFFCYRKDGSLVAILYEVCNTFNERHTYVIPAEGQDGAIRQSCDKALYVSPFMPMDCRYHFTIEPPEDGVAVRILETDAEGKLLFAAFEGRRSTLSDGALMKALLTYPLMTVKITAAIHWEALRLWSKGIRVFRHKPAEVAVASSLVDTKERGELHEQSYA